MKELGHVTVSGILSCNTSGWCIKLTFLSFEDAKRCKRPLINFIELQQGCIVTERKSYNE